MNVFFGRNYIKITTYNYIIIGGDFNVIPEDIDVYDPKKYVDDALFKNL